MLSYTPSTIELEGSFKKISVVMSDIPQYPYVVQLDGSNINKIESMLSFCELSKIEKARIATFYTWIGSLQ